MTRTMFLCLALPVCGLPLLASACERDGGDEVARMASVDLVMSDGTPMPGDVIFTERDGHVQIKAELHNLPRGKHGLHIHEGTQCDQPTFESAAGHFAPEGNPHGAPSDERHHAGDLGNIEAGEDGVAKVDIDSRSISLEPNATTSVIGRALIVHGQADDMKSQPSGDAGSRIACGLIQLTQTESGSSN